MNLYQITNEYVADVAKLKSLDLDDDAIADTMEGMAGNLEDKLVNYCYAIKELEAESKEQEAIAKSHLERSNSAANRAEYLKKSVATALKISGKEKVNRPEFVIGFRKNPPSVIVDDISLIPMDYFKPVLPPPPSLDKSLVKAAIQDGFVVSGAHLEQGESLTIK